MKLKIKLITNLITLAILDASFLIGAYSLSKEVDIAVIAILLAAFGVGLAIVLDTITIIKELRRPVYTFEQYCEDTYENEDEEICELCGELYNYCTCEFIFPTCREDIEGCDGKNCGPDCCSVTGGKCCKDGE